ncbi:MAG TPA: hypothetical protein DEB39_04915 [Planctomycetaceae bacterium]|nr:hypothetical protein [Planctomycetaceae bacterium]
MGFLKHFFHNVFREETAPMEPDAYDRIPRIEMESHLSVARYASFTLTDAIRPSFDLNVVPEEGYRFDHYRDEASRVSIPVLMGSVSKERLFEAFLDLLEPLGPTVDVVLESSHGRNMRGHDDLYREQIDTPVLKSFLYDYEDLLLNDGCTGIAILDPETPMEVQFDEHKLLIVYAEHPAPFESIFAEHGVPRKERLRFLTETEHIHSSRAHHADAFRSLCTTLGIDAD